MTKNLIISSKITNYLITEPKSGTLYNYNLKYGCMYCSRMALLEMEKIIYMFSYTQNINVLRNL